MPYNGNGNFNLLYNFEQDRDNGIKIRADRMDGQLGDMATGLSTAITRDGQSPATANIPMGGFRITGLGDGSAATDAATLGQIQTSSGQYFTTAGTIDAYTINPTPAITSYTSGLKFYVKIHATSISTTPTLNVSGQGAITIEHGDLSALTAGELKSGGVYEVMYESTSNKFLTPNLIQNNPFGLANAGYYTSNFAATVDNAVYTVYPPTAGLFVGLNNSSTSAGKFLMFVYVGPYPLYLYGTINGVSQTIAFNQRQTFPLACTTTDGWV